MSSLLAVLAVFSDYQDLASRLSVAQVEMFIALARHLKPRIALQVSTPDAPPPTLPRAIHDFLSSATGADDLSIKLCWEALKVHIWELDACEANPALYRGIFEEHAYPLGIGFRDLMPPTRVCLEPACQLIDPLTHGVSGRLLQKEYIHPGVLFSHDLGPLPVWTSSWWCSNCTTRYYHNYSVDNRLGPDTQRVYYNTQLPAVIQISDHFFVTAQLCEWIANQMVCAWVSGSNNARIYNQMFPPPALPSDWKWSTELTCEQVWDAFFLHALLLHHERHANPLQLPEHAASHDERLSTALAARNSTMVGPGQQDWAHACNLCCKIVQQADGNPGIIRSFVTDGITMGHPACGQHNCQNPLPSGRARFCTVHQHLDRLCCARTNGSPCPHPRTHGSRTCDIEEHKKLETRYTDRGRAMFQLKQRLTKLNISQMYSSIGQSRRRNANEGHGGDSDDDVDGDDLCPSKPETGNRTLRARFGRSRTHNEELCVGSCGVIIGRATMFGSEAPSSVIQFWKTLFPTKKSLPSCMWHDNNCTILRMLERAEDTYFKHIALPVDVFHFKCKHKESDLFCSMNCNPMQWADLQVDGKWAFNSSAAEQANVWMGGFRAIVREMRPDRAIFLGKFLVMYFSVDLVWIM
ncbi:hypothetical protein EXIGLDRAFT_768232 [Exidia glandulosa HHB12029]|uniref:CxC6 like cysteine cluster associated with KDZ domain-containing protein n=1 Tax=Exidia glandulosa HHB12029 TaxID=1314781 RepID=A0A166ALR8_EXIGL|nr:hypothetical protein EXIGLDRAFT_768232 [Exidia glandulosa HHB12029]